MNDFGTAIQTSVNLLGDADSTGSITGQRAFYGFDHIYKIFHFFSLRFLSTVSAY